MVSVCVLPPTLAIRSCLPGCIKITWFQGSEYAVELGVVADFDFIGQKQPYPPDEKYIHQIKDTSQVPAGKR